MTIWDLIALARRRWPITAAGALATLLAAVYLVLLPGVYYSQVDVIILPPRGEEGTNAFLSGTSSLISIAGAVASVVGSPQRGGVDVPGQASLPGVGVTDGYSVRLPNIGGQWAVNYDGPNIDVQAVGSSPAEVKGYMNNAVRDINAQLLAWQVAQGVPPANMVRTQLSPPIPVIERGSGSRLRTLAAVTLLGVGITLTGAAYVDRRSLRRSTSGGPTRRHASRGRPAEAAASAGQADPAPVG